MPKILTDQELSDFRNRLCNAAEHLFAEKGLSAVSMRQLASALNVSTMTPYRYFRDKEEILATVRARGLNRFSEALEQAHTRSGTVRSRGHIIAEAYINFAMDNPDTYKVIFDLSQPGAQDYPDLVAASARATQTMTAWVQDMISAGEIAGDPENIGRMYWAAIHGAVVLELAGRLPPGSARGLYKDLASTLFLGLKANS